VLHSSPIHGRRWRTQLRECEELRRVGGPAKKNGPAPYEAAAQPMPRRTRQILMKWPEPPPLLLKCVRANIGVISMNCLQRCDTRSEIDFLQCHRRFYLSCRPTDSQLRTPGRLTQGMSCSASGRRTLKPIHKLSRERHRRCSHGTIPGRWNNYAQSRRCITQSATDRKHCMLHALGWYPTTSDSQTTIMRRHLPTGRAVGRCPWVMSRQHRAQRFVRRSLFWPRSGHDDDDDDDEFTDANKRCTRLAERVVRLDGYRIQIGLLAGCSLGRNSSENDAYRRTRFPHQTPPPCRTSRSQCPRSS